MGDLTRFESILTRVCLSEDPAFAAAEAALDPDLPRDLRQRLARADADGLRLTGLLIVRLRFERLQQGSRVAIEWFERDPQGFAMAFKRYHGAVPPTAGDPVQEAGLFDTWVRTAGSE